VTQEFTHIDGGCHCGVIRFVLKWPEVVPNIGVRQCSCTFCQKHAGAWTSHQDAELTIELSDESLVSRYRFGTKTADFYVCSVCGVVPFVLSEIGGINYAVVNVNTFVSADKIHYSCSSTDFDGEGTSSRLDRRARNWISNVQFSVVVTG